MYLGETFSYYNKTNECYIWRYKEQSEESRLYIHKWRVPEPVPSTIDVSIRFKTDFYAEDTIKEKDVAKQSNLKSDDIIKKVYLCSYHSKTIRYDTEKGNDRPFDSIYIPKSFLKGKEDEKIIQVVIKWK